MDIGSMIGQGAAAYGQGVKPGGQQQTPLQAVPLQYQKVQAPGVAPQMGAPAAFPQPQPQQVTPQQAFQPQQQWGMQLGTGDPNRGITEMRGLAAGNAARQSSLAAAISNFRESQALGGQSQQAQPPQRAPQANLAQLTRQVQADTAQESAAQQYRANPNYQWANQQHVNPENVQTMNAAEDYVNNNQGPQNLFELTRGISG